MLFIFLARLGNLMFSVLNLPLPLVSPVHISLFTFPSLCLVAKCLKSLPCAQNQSCFARHPVFRREALSHSLAARLVCIRENRVAQVHPSAPRDEEGPAVRPSRLLWLLRAPCSSAGHQQHGMESSSSQQTAQERRLTGSSPAE